MANQTADSDRLWERRWDGYSRLAATMREQEGMDAFAQQTGGGCIAVEIHVEGCPGYWYAGDNCDEHWGASHCPNDDACDEDAYVESVIECDWDNPDRWNAEAIAHSLAGAIWLWHRFHTDGGED